MALWGISDLIFMQFFCVPTYCSMNMHYISDQKRLLIKIITELIRKNHPRQQEIIIMTNILLRARYALCLVFVLFCFSAIGNVGSLFPDQRLNWTHGPCSGSTESWPLNHKGTPRHWLYQCYHLVLKQLCDWGTGISAILLIRKVKSKRFQLRHQDSDRHSTNSGPVTREPEVYPKEVPCGPSPPSHHHGPSGSRTSPVPASSFPGLMGSFLSEFPSVFYFLQRLATVCYSPQRRTLSPCKLEREEKERRNWTPQDTDCLLRHIIRILF